MLVAGLSKQTMALQDDELHFAHIRIQSCRHSNIYIMAPVRYISYIIVLLCVYNICYDV